MSEVDGMGDIERWWRIDFHDHSEWTDDKENALDAHEHYDYPVTGPFVLEAQQPEGAVSAAAAVIEAWDTWMSDMRGDEDDQASFHMLRDAIDHLRGGR